MGEINYFGWFLFSIWLFFAYFIKVRMDYFFELKKQEKMKPKSRISLMERTRRS